MLLGTSVNFRNTVIIFTSNVGSQDILEEDGNPEVMKEKVTNAMKEKVSSIYCLNSFREKHEH